MKALKWITACLCVLLFPFGYWIAIYVYPDDCNKFFDLRYNLYAGLILLAFLSGYLGTENKGLKFVFNVGIGLSIADVVDRIYFKTTRWESNDNWMILFTILVAIIDYNKEKIYDRIAGNKR